MRVASAVAIVVATAAAVAACTTDYQDGSNDTPYGGPNALGGKERPGTTLKRGCPTDLHLTPSSAACKDSFKPLLAAFVEAGCTETSRCHGGVEVPVFTGDNPLAAWTALAEYPFPDGKLYINPCSDDPAESTLTCNLLPPGQACGKPMPVGRPASDALKAAVETFVRCGAPNPAP